MPLTLAEHIAAKTIHTIECGFCLDEQKLMDVYTGPSTRENYATRLRQDGWRYVSTGAGGEEGIACRQCISDMEADGCELTVTEI